MKEGVPAGTELRELWRIPTSDYPRGLSFDATGTSLAVGSADGTVTVVDPASGQTRWTARLPDCASTLAFSSTGARLAVACFDGSTRLFEASGRELARLPGEARGWVEWLAWSSQGLLATAQGRAARVWTAEGGEVLQTPPHESTLSGVAFSPDGSRLLTACYGAVRLFPLEPHLSVRVLKWKSSLLSLAPSPDGKVVAVATQDNSVHFWRLASGRDSEMSGYPTKPTALAWSPDSRLLCTGGGALVHGWRFEGKGPEGTDPWLLGGHEDEVTVLVFARTGLLASGARDGEVLLWEPRKSELPVGGGAAGAEVCELRFSPDGALLAAASAEHLIAWSVVRGLR